MVLFDRLETRRTVHITLGVFALLPFWWHVEAGPTSTCHQNGSKANTPSVMCTVRQVSVAI